MEEEQFTIIVNPTRDEKDSESSSESPLCIVPHHDGHSGDVHDAEEEDEGVMHILEDPENEEAAPTYQYNPTSTREDEEDLTLSESSSQSPLCIQVVHHNEHSVREDDADVEQKGFLNILEEDPEDEEATYANLLQSNRPFRLYLLSYLITHAGE